MSSTLSQEQYEGLKIIEGEQSTIITTAIIRLFTYNQKDQKWSYSGLCGALCLVVDRAMNGAVLFRLYDLNSYDLLFEQELFYEFENLYQELNEFFFCFPIIGNFILAFSFADSNEALNMKLKINRYCPKKPQPKNEEILPLAPVLKSKKNVKTTNLDKKDDAKIIMEKPINVKHLNHIGWDHINKCFDFSLLSKEFKKVFKHAGIKKRDLKNAETALAIYETLLNQGTAQPNKSKNNLKSKPEISKGKKHSIFGGISAALKKKITIDRNFSKEAENEEKKENEPPAIPLLGPNNPPNIPLPPKLNLNLSIPPPPPLELSKISQKNPFGLEEDQTPKKPVSKQKFQAQTIPESSKNGLIDQIRAGNFQLKKVDKSKVDDIPNKQLTKQEEMSLTMVLAKAIAERRKNMKKDESDSEPESDWSED